MELSYEETMQRIAEFEKNERNKYIEGVKAYGFDEERFLYEIEKYDKKFKYQCCRENHFPWSVNVFKGEHQMIVVPYVISMFWYGTAMARYRILNENESPEIIGKAILDSFEHISRSPVDARTPAERAEDSYWKETKCKTYRAFAKKYMRVAIREDEQGIYSVYNWVEDKPVMLPSTALAVDIGNAVVNAFSIAAEYKKAKKPDPYPPVEIELLSDKTVIIFPPRDRHFTDCDDCGAAELYKAYGYCPKEGADSSAEFYLGIAAELDCDMSGENIRRAWEELHGKSEFFEVKPTEYGIWGLRAEMKNKSVHRISYLLQIDESELLDCTMELRKPNSRKKLDEKLSVLFEEFAGKCRLNTNNQ